jgi:hypothetical protein
MARGSSFDRLSHVGKKKPRRKRGLVAQCSFASVSAQLRWAAHDDQFSNWDRATDLRALFLLSYLRLLL